MRRFWLFFALCFVLIGWILGGDGTVNLGQRFLNPGPVHPMGTDELGRDLLARFLRGGAISVTLALLITGLNLAMGVGLAVLCHPLAPLRRLLLGLSDLLASIPTTLLALLLLAMLPPGITSLVVALAIGGWIPFARLVMNRLDVLREDASLVQVRIQGGKATHKLIHHLLPRLWPLLGTQASIGMGAVVLVEGGLSFLGVGLPPEMASWGTMLASGRTFLLVSPWGLLWPAAGMLSLLIATDFVRGGMPVGRGC